MNAPLSIEQRSIGDARELDDQRQVLVEELVEWRAGARHEGLCDAIEALIDAKIDHRLSHLAYPQRMTDKGSLEMPTGTCPGETRGTLGETSPVQRLPDELEPWERCWRYGRADLTLHPLVRDAYKVARLIERCGGSPELTHASSHAFALCEALSDYARHNNELEELVEQFNDGHTPPEEP